MRRFLQWGYRFSLWFALFFCGILLVLSGAAIVQQGGEFREFRAIPVTLLLAAGIALSFAWAWKAIQDRGRKVSAVLFLCIVGMQVFFLAMVSRPMSIADPARVQNEAQAMLKLYRGQMNAENIYMQNYPNNHFIVIVFYYFYKILESVGVTKVWVPTVILNVFCIDLGIYFTYAAAKNIKGMAVANMTLLLFLLCPTTYLWLTSAYTNTMSFPFLMAILYLGLDRKDSFFHGKTVARLFLLGVLAVVGFFLRPTTVIGVIALAIDYSVHSFRERGERGSGAGSGSSGLAKRLGKSLAKFALLFFACGITWIGCSRLIDRHVDRERFTGAFPVAHWVMMGMNEESQGGFSREDRLYTASFSDLEEKRQADVERLGQRLRHMGISGVGRHFMHKLTRVWALGDDDGISNSMYAYYYPPLFSYFIGGQNAWFVFYMQAFRIAMFFLMGCAVIGQLRQPECQPLFLYILTFLGAVCFFLIWEAGKRYNVCFNGICLFLMAAGIQEMGQWAGRAACDMAAVIDGMKDGRRKLAGKIIRAVLVAGTICLLAGGLVSGAGYGGHTEIQRKVYYCSKMGSDSESIDWKGVMQADVLEQTIETGQLNWGNKWNRLKIFFANWKPAERRAEYRVELISLEDNRVIYSREIAPRNVKPGGAFILKLNHKKKSEVGYKLRLTHLGKSCNLIPMVCKFPLLDPYPYGSLSVNGRERGWDLSMCIYSVQKS